MASLETSSRIIMSCDVRFAVSIFLLSMVLYPALYVKRVLFVVSKLYEEAQTF